MAGSGVPFLPLIRDDSSLWDDPHKFLPTSGSLNFFDVTQYTNDSCGSFVEELPDSITGTYYEDYNIKYVHNIIIKKLKREAKDKVPKLRQELRCLTEASGKPQNWIQRTQTLKDIEKIKTRIHEIVSGRRLDNYLSRVNPIIDEYGKYSGCVKKVVFGIEDEKYQEITDSIRRRMILIDRFFDIADDYITINVIRTSNRPTDMCSGCGISLIDISTDNGTKICPECETEHSVILLNKLPKDGSRININSSGDDESIDNFLRAFIRYQGLQTEQPDESLYRELDTYFVQHGCMTGEQIRKLPLNSSGRRGETTHAMLLDALKAIGRSDHYEDVNLIGHIYWGWTLSDLSAYKETIINQYMKTQKVFYQIPPEERERNSSLGTQYRLWRHLQLVGHPCSMSDFKIAENETSLRIHNNLWRMMCEGANDPEIYYIE